MHKIHIQASSEMNRQNETRLGKGKEELLTKCMRRVLGDSDNFVFRSFYLSFQLHFSFVGSELLFHRQTIKHVHCELLKFLYFATDGFSLILSQQIVGKMSDYERLNYISLRKNFDYFDTKK